MQEFHQVQALCEAVEVLELFLLFSLQNCVCLFEAETIT